MTSSIQGDVAQQPATIGRPPAALPAPAGEPVDGPEVPDYIDEMQREVAAEEGRDPDAELDEDGPIPDDAVTVPLGRDHVIHVMPQGQWRSSSLSAVNRGDFDEWASECVYDFFSVWLKANPTLDEIQNMFADMRELTGQDQGKSTAARRFSRRGRRR